MVRAAPHPRPLDSGACTAVFLASRSPRRRRLLEQAGLPHTAADPGLDDGELSPGEATPAMWVAALAYLKAVAGRERAGHRGLVLGADTVCVLDGRILGQPRDRDEAGTMLRSLEGRSHEVLTGVALLTGKDAGERQLFVDRAAVRMGILGTARIEEYLNSGGWEGKAGAYNLEDRLHAGWPIEFDGDPGTIMGLPIRKLVPRLRRLGIVAQVPQGGAA
jgi:septum formation protein